MKNFSEFCQNRNNLEAEAWRWIVRLDSEDSLTKREKDQLIEWLGRSPAHVETIKTFNEFWTSPVLDELIQPKPAKTKVLKPMWAVVASLMFVLFAANWLYNYSPEQQLAQTTYAAAIGQQQKLQLADGSQIILDANSQIEVDYTDSARDIWLIKGKAYFIVAKDKNRPFNVYAASGRVQAIGTEFSVNLAKKQQLQVQVTEGKVALALANNPSNQQSYRDSLQHVTYMTAGEYTELDRTTSFSQGFSQAIENLIALSKTQLQVNHAWINGELIFTGQTLAEVVNQLHDYTPLSIEIAEPELRSLKIGGRFRVDRIEELFKNLELNFDLVVHKTAIDQVSIRSKPTDN